MIIEIHLETKFPDIYINGAGVDNNDYRPISYAQVRAKIQEQIRNSSK